jgi:hypothetical protein
MKTKRIWFIVVGALAESGKDHFQNKNTKIDADSV